MVAGPNVREKRQVLASSVQSGKSNDGYFSGQVASLFTTEAYEEGLKQQANVQASTEEIGHMLVAMFANFEDCYRAIDVNNSGTITKVEMVSSLQSLGISPDDARKCFRELDNISRKQVLTRKEFLVLWRAGGGDMLSTPRTARTARSVSPSYTARSASRSPSPMKSSASTGNLKSEGQRLVHSFGPFLDSENSRSRFSTFTVQDVEDPVQKFAQWAAGKWDVLHGIFGYQEQNGCYVGRETLTADQFVRFVRSLGFEGNAVRVFAEIHREGPHIDRSKLAKQDEETTVEEYDETERDEITLPQLQRFDRRCRQLIKDLTRGDEGSAANRLVRLLKGNRGYLLRAWRMDLDIRGSGLVSFTDFTAACKKLGIANEARQIWLSFRPLEKEKEGYKKHRGSSAPLMFSELGADEAVNVQQFAEVLWNQFGMDVDKAWARIDTCGRKCVSIEEFAAGAKKLGFEGNAKLLFRGLDIGGLGRLWKNEFEYIKVLALSGMRKQHSAPQIQDLVAWVNEQIGGADRLLEMLNFNPNNKENAMSVSDLAARLTALGYPGDALHVAMIAARTGGGTEVFSDSLYSLIYGKRRGSPPSRGASLARAKSMEAIRRGRPDSQSRTTAPAWRPRKVWKDSVDNIAAYNDRRPPCVRNYFSIPDRESDNPNFAPQPRLAASASAPSLGNVSESRVPYPEMVKDMAKRKSRFCWGKDRVELTEEMKKRPAWDNGMYNGATGDMKFGAASRKYFEAKQKPVKEEIKRRMSARQSTTEIYLHASANPAATI